MNEHLRIFAEFLGSGNPNCGIWFAGLEEGGDPITYENLNEQLDLCKIFPYFFEMPAKIPRTGVWIYISKILAKLNEDSFSNWRDYRKNLFSESNSKVFLTELFPLPKNQFKKWGKEYKSIFNFDYSEIDKYKELMKAYRFPLIRKLWKLTKPNCTICFGKESWDYYEDLFSLGNQNKTHYEKFIYYKEPKVILSPFLGNGWFSNNDVNIITALIRKMVIQFPRERICSPIE